MQKDEIQKLLFVINPISGGKNKTNWEADIHAYFKDLPHTIEMYLLTGEDDRPSITHYIERLKPHKVIAVGGDGSIKLIAEIVQNTPTIVGIIPGGSANGMAKELNIPADLKKALDIIVDGEVKPIDLIKINDEEICLHLSDIGLNAMLVKYFEKSEKRGMWGYGKAVFRVLWGKRLMYATIKTDTETVKRKAYMIVLANASQYGTGASINPEGKVDDELFEVVVVRKIKFWVLFRMLISNKKFDNDCIEVFRTKRVHLSTLHRAYFQVDGEYRNRTKNITAAIMPHALQVMLPADDAS